MYKLVFFVPKSDLESVKEAVFATGAGKLGNYSHCSWECLGMGQFLPLKGSKPTVGVQDKLEKVEEYRVEILCAKNHVKSAIYALKDKHPYEEPAFELYQVFDPSSL